MKLKNRIYDLLPKKLDWYILKKFIFTYLIALLLIIVIVIIFDISEKIEDFVSREAPLKAIVFDYYVNFIPFFINMFSPIFTFLTVIFFTSRLAANSEIIAVLSCGISFNRLLRPYMIGSAIIMIFSLALNLWVIPHVNVTRMAFEEKYVRDYERKETLHNLHYQIAPGEFVYVESFSRWNNTAYKFTLEKIENNRIVSKISADQAVWNSTLCGWHLKRYFIRDYDAGLEDRVRCGQQMDTIIPLTISDLRIKRQYWLQLDHKQLNEHIRTKQMRGDANIKKPLIEKHTRYAMPFSAFILSIIGVSLSSRKRRGGIGWNIALGIALSFSYILFQKFSEMFVFTDTLPVVVAVWLPNVIYAVIAYILYRLAPK